MPRIKLLEQQDYAFHHNINVRITDVNQALHVGTIELTGILHDTRVNLFRQLNMNEIDLGDGRTGMVISDLAVNFKNEAFLFDEITVDSGIGEIWEYGFRLFHRVRRGDEMIALAEIGAITFDHGKKTKARVPETLIHALATRNTRQHALSAG